MKNYKLGRKPAINNLSTLRRALSMSWHLDKLGPPPSVSDDWVRAVDAVTGGNWGMDGNDMWGDCTCADCSHQKMLWTANTGKMIVPTTQQTLNLYSAITGFNPNDPNTDQGAAIVTVCQFLEDTGYLGSKLSGFAPLDPTNTNHVKWGVQLFGAVKLGINLPDSAESQFDSNQPWYVVAGAQIVGGHDVPLVKYDKGLYYVVTWGKLQAMSPNFLKTYCNECILPLSIEWLKNTGVSPSNLNLQALEEDMRQIRDQS